MCFRRATLRLQAITVACGVILSLQGCHLPNLRRAEPAPPLPPDFNGRSSEESSAKVGIDEFFNDPVLTGTISHALACNQELKILNQEVRIAANEIRARRGAYLPFVALKGEETRDFGTLKVTPFPVVHGESGGPFLAYRIDTEGRTITYSADTEWTETLIPAARDADLFVCEAYYYDRIVKNHLSLKTLEEHLPQIAPKKLVLTHMSDDMLGRLDKLPYSAAKDGMIVEL